MNKDEALKLALEALEGFIPYLPLKDEAQCNRYDKAITAIKEALSDPEQEPVGKFAKFTDNIWREVTDGSAGVPLYTTPPQRKPLPFEQVDSLWHNTCTGDFILDIREFAQAIEAAHGIKEKNND